MRGNHVRKKIEKLIVLFFLLFWLKRNHQQCVKHLVARRRVHKTLFPYIFLSFFSAMEGA